MENNLHSTDPEYRNNLSENNRGNSSSKKNKIIGIVVVLLGIMIILGSLLFFASNINSGLSHEKDDQSEAFLQTNNVGNNTLAEQMKKIKEEEEEQRRKKEREENDRLKAEKAKSLLDETLKETNKTTAINPSTNENNPDDPRQRKMQGNLLYGVKEINDTQSNDNSLNNSLSGEFYANGSIKVINDPSYLLISGTTIPCVMQTKIVTSYQGFLKCMITRNIYSSDGEAVLIPKGSIAKGEQKKAIIQGVSRVFVSWNVIDTTDNLRVKIDSLGTDQLGASGVEANIDNHFWDRFGGAIMLSLIQDSLQTASNKISTSGNNDVYYDNSENNASRMAELALENSINIPPTGYINQGALINILLVRDVNFSSYR